MAFRDSINDLMFRFYERFKQNNNRLPVSVDADINLGDVQIGTVKQGGVDEGAEPWKVKAEELEQKIDALKQSIESGVQLKGRSVEDGSLVEGPSYEVDPNGYAALRVVEAAPVAYDELTDSLQVRVVYDNVMEELHSEVNANGIVTLNKYPASGGAYVVPLSADVRAYSKIIVVVRWMSATKATIVVDWSLKGLSLAATDRMVEEEEDSLFTFAEFKNRTPMLREVQIRNHSDSPRTIHGIGVMGVR